MIDLRTASRSAARVARHRRAAPASELALVVLYTQAAIVGGLFQACPTDSISRCRFQCYRPLVDHIRSIDYVSRAVRFLGKCPPAIVVQVQAKLQTLLF